MLNPAMTWNTSGRHIPDLRNDFALVAEPVHPGARQLLDYWRERVADGGFVVGRDIPARRVVKLLPNVTVYEPLADGSDLRVRLAGGAIRRRFGKEIKGRYMSELFSPEDFKRHHEDSREVLRSGAPAFVDSRLLRENNLEMHLEVVILPVTAPDKISPWLLIGLFYFD